MVNSHGFVLFPCFFLKKKFLSSDIPKKALCNYNRFCKPKFQRKIKSFKIFSLPRFCSLYFLFKGKSDMQYHSRIACIDTILISILTFKNDPFKNFETLNKLYVLESQPNLLRFSFGFRKIDVSYF